MVDRRRYNAPSSDEIAGIVPDDNLATVSSRDIVVHTRDGGLKFLSEMHRAYDALHFVLMHPYGEHGWHPGIPLHDPDEPDEVEHGPLSQEDTAAAADFELYSEVM